MVDDARDDDEEDLFRCAICGTAEGDSSNLTNQNALMTNATIKCGHQFCHSCVEREFVRRREFPCPICENPVKRVNLTQRTLDDVQCEKDTSWRRRVLSVFNKTQNDFPSLLEYNNYLEEVEDMIYAIVNEEATAEDAKAKIREYESAYKADIVVRQSQRADEARSVQDRIAAEQRQTEQQRLLTQEEEKLRAATKRKWKKETTQVLLGEREEVSAEVRAAQLQGYRNEVLRQTRAASTAVWVSPRVREPAQGWKKETLDRDLYRKRQAAGGGVVVGSIATHERNWNQTVSSLFCNKTDH